MTVLPWIPTNSRASSPGEPLDRFAFFVPRVDAIVVGRVIEAGSRKVPLPTATGEAMYRIERYAMFQVDRTLLGPPLGPRLEVRLGQEAPLALFQSAAALSPDRRAIAYLNEDRTGWVVRLNINAEADDSFAGLELLAAADVPNRIRQIESRLQQCSPESMALTADACVVGTLEAFEEGAPLIRCRVKQTVFGSVPEEILSIRTDGTSGLRLGEAVLFLKKLSNGEWRPLEEGAGCRYVDLGNLLKHAPSAADLTARAAAARARIEEGRSR